MKEAGKSLGQFVAEVLGTISGATYIPAAVLVSGTALSGMLMTSTDSESPIDAIAGAPSPSFAELALFVVIVAVVAAVLEPIQFWVTRFFEGHVGPWPTKRTEAHRRRWLEIQQRRDTNVDSRERFQQEADSYPKGSEERNAARAAVRRTEQDDHVLALSLRHYPLDPHRILPTRLGNIVRSYEDRANQRLQETGWGASLPGRGEIQDLLPFAYFAIPAETREQHDRFRSQLQASTALMGVVPIVGIAIGVSTWHFHWGWSIATFAASVVLTWSASSGAKGAGDGYGTMLLAIAEQYSRGAFKAESTTEISRSDDLTLAS